MNTIPTSKQKIATQDPLMDRAGYFGPDERGNEYLE